MIEWRRLYLKPAGSLPGGIVTQWGAGIGAGRVSADEAMFLAGPSPETGQRYTEEEWKLRERLRLEAVERRSRSLRSSPVAQTYRQLDGGARTDARHDCGRHNRPRR